MPIGCELVKSLFAISHLVVTTIGSRLRMVERPSYLPNHENRHLFETNENDDSMDAVHRRTARGASS